MRSDLEGRWLKGDGATNVVPVDGSFPFGECVRADVAGDVWVESVLPGDGRLVF